MHHLSKKKKELIRRIVVYALMVVSICATVTFITFLVLGFRFNFFDGQVEQYSFLQFSSTPSGATITVDGVNISTKTPSKSSVKPGLHQIEMKKDGYETWAKTINVKPGTLTWLSYALLIPQTLSVEVVKDIEQVYSSIPSPKGRGLIIQHKVESPEFELVDISSSLPKITKLTIPESVYSDSANFDVVHSFALEKWDDDGRYVLVRHLFGEKNEWLVLDTQNPILSKNISSIFNIDIESIDFSGTSGNYYFIVQSDDIRKLDITGGTISRVLASNVSNFFVYEANIIVYVGKLADGSGGSVIGAYRDGDGSSYVIETLENNDASSIKIATTHYFNQDYIAYSDGQTVNVIGGKYPNNFSDISTTLSLVSSFLVSGDITNLNFSPTGQYVLAQSATSVSSYDIEYQTINTIAIKCADVKLPVRWLDNNYLWSSCGGALSVMEFDGANTHIINSVVPGQAAVLTHNSRYIYSINKIDIGYQLQRVRVILP